MWVIKEENSTVSVYQDKVCLFTINNINLAYWKSIKPIIELAPELFILFSKVVKKKQEQE